MHPKSSSFPTLTVIDTAQVLTSDLACTGTITIDEGGSLDGNGLTFSSDQSPAIVIKNGGMLENVVIAGKSSVGVRFDDDNGSLNNVKYEGSGTAVEIVDGSGHVEVRCAGLLDWSWDSIKRFQYLTRFCSLL